MESITRNRKMLIQLSEFVKELDESVRAEAFRFLLTQELGEASARSGASAPASRREPTSRAVAPQELIRKSRVSMFTQKAVVLAYWLEEYQQKSTFTSSDLRGAFEQAREQAPRNLSDLVAKLEATARIMKAEKVDAVQYYRLTGSAMQEVDRWLSPKEGKEA